MKLTSKIITILHIMFTYFISLYPFIIQNKSYDYLYILYFLVLHFTWYIFESECYISYFVKKLENNKYIMGDDHGIHDIEILIKNKELINIHYNIVVILFSISPLYIIYRSNFGNLFYMIIIYLNIVVYSLNNLLKNENSRNIIRKINSFIVVIFIIYYILYFKK